MKIACLRAVGSLAFTTLLVAACSGSGTTNLSGADGATDAPPGADTGAKKDSGSKKDAAASKDSGTSKDGTVSSDTGTSDTGVPPADTGTHDGGAHPDAARTDAPSGHDGATDAGSGDAKTPPKDGSEGTPDAKKDSAADSGVTVDSGTDAGTPACTGTNTACNLGGFDGLCKADVCSNCVTTTDNAACTAAYGAPNLCLAGICVPGNCLVDTDCPTGEICGLSQAHTCGKCSTDAQCQTDATYGKTFVCDIGTGACVANTCSTANDTACTTDPGDVCCSSTCTPGNCCDNAYCHTLIGNNAACVANTCTTCDPVGNKTYVVDPLNGDDGTATGSGTTGGGTTQTASCAFKSITRALAVIGPTPGLGTIIQVKNTAAVGASESFPIVVPANVTITGTGGTPTVNVPANKTGFRLTGANSGLANLLLDAANTVGTTGIVVDTGTAATTTLAGVTVENMAGDGIEVINAGVLTIGAGTASNTNGTKANPATGLYIAGTAKVTIQVDSGTAATFNGNTSHGIHVSGLGSISIGVDQGSINPAAIADGNTIANLYIEQTPGGVAAPPANLVSNFQANGSLTTHGIHIFGGSALTLRTSTALGNKEDGVYVTNYNVDGTKSSDVTHIDLGTVASFGHNVLQAATGATPAPNTGAGVCLDLPVAAAQTLNAAGDTFELANCATATPGAIKRSNTCTGGTDIAITGAATTNAITTLNCTHP